MSPVVIVCAPALAAVASHLLTPVAIRVAQRTHFLDRPAGYKAHGSPTPYLGGAALLTALLATALPLGGATGSAGTLLACALGVWALGTLDDRHPVSPGRRVIVELGLAAVLWFSGIGWDVAGSGVAGFLVTALWVVGIVNAFNLMDNMDGAATTVGGVSFAAIATLAILHDATGPAVLALAMAGACLGFLHYNLAGPARIFLGDGGSMTIGFLVAGLALMAAKTAVGGSGALAGGALLAGVPVLDTTLVVISRTRRRVSVLTGGRDHLSHRLLEHAGSPRRVAVLLALTQCSLTSLAVVGSQLGEAVLLGFASFALGVGALAIAGLEGWTPLLPGVPTARGELDMAVAAGSVITADGLHRISSLEALSTSTSDAL